MKKIHVVLAALFAAFSAFAAYDYTRMDFIKCNGNNWCNTGYTPACTDKIEMKLKLDTRNSTQALFCTRQGGADRTITAFFIWSSNKLTMRADYNNKQIDIGTQYQSDTAEHVFIMDGNAHTFTDNGTKKADLATGTFTPVMPLILFCSQSVRVGNGTSNYAKYYFYYCKIYNKDGKLIHHFVPARDDAVASGAKQYGIYDLVDQRFCENSGTASFVVTGATAGNKLGVSPVKSRAATLGATSLVEGQTKTVLNIANPGYPQKAYIAWGDTDGGSDTTAWDHFDALADITAKETSRTVDIPAGAKFVRFFLQPAVAAGCSPVAWIKSSGANQYMNTGFKPSPKTRADYTFAIEQGAAFQFATPFGSRKDNTFQFFCGAAFQNNNYWFRRYGNQNRDNIGNGNPGVLGEHSFSLDHNVYTLDGVVTTMSAPDFAATYDAYVFAVNNNNVASQFCPCKFYTLTLWDDECIVRDYIPVKDSNNQPAFYDAVNGTLIYNLGATALTMGDVVWTQTETIPTDLTAARTSSWTGAGTDPADLTDPANWASTNVVGNAVAAAPTVLTDVTITHGDTFNCPPGTTLPHRNLTIADCTLTQDLDWRGLGLDLVVNSNIDVNGHTLKVATLAGSGRIADNTGWTILDSVQSLGDQHIILDYVPACTDKIETEVYASAFSGNQCLWCSRVDGTVLTMTAFYINSNFRIDRYYAVSDLTDVKPVANQWQHIVADYKTCEFTVDGVTSATRMQDGNFAPTSKLCLFASHAGDSETAGVNNKAKIFMRTFKVYDENGNLKVNLQPRMRNSDDKCGLYDLVSGTFYVASASHRMGDIVSTEATGTLVVDVTDGTPFTDTTFNPLGINRQVISDNLMLGGGLKVVKEGSQMLVLGKQWQNFAGGLVINAGVAKPRTRGSDNTYSEQYRIMGARNGTILVNSGAYLSIGGNYDYAQKRITLNGGTLTSGNNDMATTGYGTVTGLLLTDDSAIDSNVTLTFEGAVDLGGHTLTASTVGGKSIYFGVNYNSSMTNGTLVLGKTGSAGWLHTLKPVDMRTVDLVQNRTALGLGAEMHVHDFYANYFQNASENVTHPLYVHGKFTPATQYFYGATMCDGSTIDLSAKNAAWSVTSAITTGKNTVDFEPGATVTIDIHDRTLAVGDKIVSWVAQPENVTFQWDAATAGNNVACISAADGLYYGADPASTVVEKAVWTGAANDGDLKNPANWSCYNLAGAALADRLPTIDSTVELSGTTTFNFTSAQWLPLIDSPIDSENKAETICTYRPYGTTRTALANYDFIDMSADDYLFVGPAPLTNLRTASWTNTYLDNSQLRFDGWFKVTAEQAGTWTLREKFDDYFALIVDGTCVVSNNTYTTEVTAQCTMTEGWHRFTLLCGDTTGGQGPTLTIGGKASALGVTINGGTEVAFEDAFTFGSGPAALWKKVRVADGCKLGADCDWSAAHLNPDFHLFELYGTLDLNGHSLTTTVHGNCTGTITNSSETVGTFCYRVPALVAGNHTSLKITGNTKFVKDGPGNMTVYVTGETYTAGTEIFGGTVKASANAGDRPFGPENSQIIVHSGATFDQAAKGAYGFYKFILDGGSIKSSADAGSGLQQIYDLRLTADSYVAGTYNFGMIGGGYAPTFIDLGGHTLSVSVVSGKHFWVYNTTISNGVLKTTSGGHIDFAQTAVYAYDVDFDNNIAIIHNVDAHFRDFTDRYCANYGSGSGHICVHGTYTPVGTHFHNAKLMDGSTIDLSAKSGAWDTKSLNTSSATKYCTFADGATVTVDCHGRNLAAGDKLITWATKPTGVTFKLDAASAQALGDATLAAKADGLYIDRLTYVGGAIDALTSWQDAAGENPTAINGYPLHLPAHAGDPTAVGYATGPSALTSLADSPVYVEGVYDFTAPGGLYLAKLDVAATGRVIIDPLACTLRLKGAPVFAAGAKLALSANYADYTTGHILLMTWDVGTIDPASLATLFDTASASGTNPQFEVETLSNGGGRLWLNLAGGTARPKLNVLVVGDKLTSGTDPETGKWRLQIMKAMEAAGYDVRAKGFWKQYPTDICGATMPANWIRYSGTAQNVEMSITSYAEANGNEYAGAMEMIDNALEQANDVDFVVICCPISEIWSSGRSASEICEVAVKLIGKVIADKPHAKVVFCRFPHRSGFTDEMNARAVEFNGLIETAAAENFAAGKVYLANVPEGARTVDSALLPWSVMRAAIAADPSWETGFEETKPTTSGATVNVPAAELEGFSLARVFDVKAKNGTAMNANAQVPYENYDNSTAAAADIGRVGYYIELKRRNTDEEDYRGEVRWLWASCDAFNDRDIDTVGVPLKKASACQVAHLRVRSNMPGIADTPTGETELGYVEFWRNSYGSAATANSSAPGQTFKLDWNDTMSTSTYGSMQLFRYTPGAVQPAQTLFAFNRWMEVNYEFGLGDFANANVGSLDWTFISSCNAEITETMGLGAYEVARIEIWTTPGSVTDNVVAEATWTGAANDGDIANPANWDCVNKDSDPVQDGLPDSATAVKIGATGSEPAINLSMNSAALEAKQVSLGNIKLTDDLDLSGIKYLTVDGTVDVNGHTLTLPMLVGAGTVTDSSEFDLTTTDTSKVSSSTTFTGGTAANLFNNNFARNGTDNTKRVIVTVNQLPIVADYDFGTPTVVDCYRIWAGKVNDLNCIGRYPGRWQIFGKNAGDAEWTLLTEDWTLCWNDEAHGLFFEFDNDTAYRYYRFQLNEPVDRTKDGYVEMVQLEYGRKDRFGTLVVAPPIGSTANNSTVTLSGNLRTVKQGGGTYIATKASQSAEGPLVVEAGFAKPGVGGSANAPLGKKGNQLVVKPGATLDMNGKTAFTTYTFVLDGGTLKNSADPGSVWTKATIRRIRLGADSKLDFTYYAILGDNYTPTEVRLNGHTLEGAYGTASYWSNTYFFDGTVKSNIKSGGYLESYHGSNYYKGSFYGTNTVFEFEGQGKLTINSNIGNDKPAQMGEYVNRLTTGYDSDSYTVGIEVVKRFAPETQYFRGCKLLDGATLDLSSRDGVFSVETAHTAKNGMPRFVTFADNGTFKVDLHGRRLSVGKIVDWSGEGQQPTNLAGLKFQLDAATRRNGYGLKKENDGLYLFSNNLVIFVR